MAARSETFPVRIYRLLSKIQPDVILSGDFKCAPREGEVLASVPVFAETVCGRAITRFAPNSAKYAIYDGSVHWEALYVNGGPHQQQWNLATDSRQLSSRVYAMPAEAGYPIVTVPQ